MSGIFTVEINGVNASYPVQSQITPSNGTVLLSLPEEIATCSFGLYTVHIITPNNNNGTLYTVLLNPPMLHMGQTVVATIGIPSGKILDMHISNAAQCVQSGVTVTNGTGFFC